MKNKVVVLGMGFVGAPMSVVISSSSKNGKKLAFSSNRDAQNPRNTNIFIADVVYK